MSVKPPSGPAAKRPDAKRPDVKRPEAETKTKETGRAAEPPLDRPAYLKELRAGLLRKLGLPEDAKPERVASLLAIKARLDGLKKK